MKSSEKSALLPYGTLRPPNSCQSSIHIEREKELRPILYLDALFLKVRDEGRVVSKALYLAVGVNLQGRKEVLGLWLGQGEGAKFYLQLLNELKSRGVSDVFYRLRRRIEGAARSTRDRLPAYDCTNMCRDLVRHSFEFRQREGSQGRVFRVEAREIR